MSYTMQGFLEVSSGHLRFWLSLWAPQISSTICTPRALRLTSWSFPIDGLSVSFLSVFSRLGQMMPQLSSPKTSASLAYDFLENFMGSQKVVLCFYTWPLTLNKLWGRITQTFSLLFNKVQLYLFQ